MVMVAAIDPFGVHFRQVITSEEVGCEKPDPKNFRIIADKLGVPIDRCCVIGDSWENDIEPALQLGCSVIWTQEFARTQFDRRDVPIIHSLNEITKWLQIRKAS